MRVLVVNAGSSSLKLTLLDGDDTTIAARELEAPRAQVDPEELRDGARLAWARRTRSAIASSTEASASARP